MKKIFLLLSFVSFFSFAHASTNCSTGCDVDGATFFDTNIQYLNWNSSASDASLTIKSPTGSVVATVSTANISDWGTSKLMPFYPQADGNYRLEVFSQGIDNNYQLELNFISGGVPSVFQDTNCTGTGCGGSTKTYKFNVANSPALIFDDNRFMNIPVKGGNSVAVYIRFLEGGNCPFSGACDASIAIRRLSDNNVVAFKNTGQWSDWSNSPILLDWNADYDGNYAFEVGYEGSIARYDINFMFLDTNGAARLVSDYSQYIGSSLTTGLTTQHFFSVTGSPPLALDDEKEFTPPVKGASLMNISVQFYDGHDCPFSGACNVSIGVRRLSDNSMVAFKSDDSWSSWNTPVLLDWWADYDSNYAIEIGYEGTWGQYDLNISYVDTSGQNHLYSDRNQYIGSGLATGNTTRYLFSVLNSSTIIFDDTKTFVPTVKGGNRLFATFRFYDGHNCPFSGACNVSIAIRRLSDNNVVAFRSDDSWSSWQSPITLDWLADYDGGYDVEVGYEGTWVQYDVNVSYTSTADSNVLLSDNYQYVGSGLGTGQTTQYFFNVGNGPAVLFHDTKTIPYNAGDGKLFKAKVKMYDGHSCPFSGACDASFAIKDQNGSTVTSISTGDYSTFNNTLIQFTPITNHSYYIELGYEGTWVQYDMNIDYQDTADINRHFEDKYQYVGSGLGTGQQTQYFINNGPSCGNGINCPPPASFCVPVILNGDPADKIDIVFVGSGFPNTSTFGQVVDDMIDYDGNEFGIMHYSPFKDYRDKFNFWRVDQTPTFSGGPYFVNGQWVHYTSYYEEARALANSCAAVNENPKQFVALLVAPLIHSHASADSYHGVGLGESYVTIGQEYLDNCTVPGPDCPVPWPLMVRNLVDYNFWRFANNRFDVQKTVVHEFGHSFGGLADEYDKNAAASVTSGQTPNCDSSNICPKWSSFPNIDCLRVCGFNDWYRPYAQSMMRSQFWPNVTFKAVNENELEKDINAIVDNMFLQAPQQDYSYSLNLHYLDGNVYLKNLSVVSQSTSPPLSQPSTGYKLRVYSDDGILYDTNFLFPVYSFLTPSLDWFDQNGDQIVFPTSDTMLTDSDINYLINVPYFSSAKLLRIFDENETERLVVDLTPYSTKLSYTIGYGGGSIQGGTYNAIYAISSQPIARVTSQNYVCSLGNIV